MAEKILNLKLKYKNKDLDYARYGRDFTNKFLIGSDKHIFWQILDKAFPSNYTLINKKGNNFTLNLREGMYLSVKKSGKDLSKDELKRDKILKGNTLRMDKNTEGSISFSGQWAIEYFYKEPYVYKASPEELALAKQFAKFPPLTHEQKFTRIFLILGLLFTAIGLYIGEATYVPPEAIGIRERLNRLEEIAQRVEPEIIEEVEPDFTKGERDTGEEEEEVEEVEETVEEVTSEDFKNMFGLDLGTGEIGDADLSSELLEVTQVDEIVATASTESGVGPGGGTGLGTQQPGGGTVLDDIVGSSGLAPGEGLGDLGGLEGLDLGQGTGFDEVDLADLGGDVGKFDITKIESKAHFETVKKRFAGIKAVKEGSISVKDVAPETKTEIANIKNQINTYKPQLKQLYTVESMIMEMYGRIEFVIIIEADGKVVAVDFNISKGSYFSDSFLKKARNIILQWNIKVKNAIQYTFPMTFMKSQ